MLDRLDETIVAISSAPGYGPLGIVRLSGGRAVAILDRMASADSGKPLASFPGASRVPGEVSLHAALTLPAAFYLFRAPHSYTREDLVEVHTVGSPAALELVRRQAIELGAAPAEPGEFTARAFLNGAMNLGAAEAVAGLIRARTDTQLRAARRMTDTTFADEITRLRAELAGLLALVEADIDFAEEPIDFITPAALRERVDTMARQLARMLHGAVSTERFDLLPHLLLLGPPNVGKSALMNRLSGTRRAICAAAAGTTRDILTAPVPLGHGEAILLDSAGVDPSEDEIIAQARAMTVATAERVDLVCIVVDLTAPDEEHVFELARSLDVARVVVVANKLDLVSAEIAEQRCNRLRARRLGPVRAVSALAGTGVEALRADLADALGDAVTTMQCESVCLSERQHAALRDAWEAIRRATALAEAASETIDCAELLAFELREAVSALGSVTGEVTTEDLLGQVFAHFCIGK